MNAKKFLNYLIGYSSCFFILIFLSLSISFFTYEKEMFNELDKIENEIVYNLDIGRELDKVIDYYSNSDSIRISVFSSSEKTIKYDSKNKVVIEGDYNYFYELKDQELIRYSDCLNMDVSMKVYDLKKYNYLIRIEKRIENTFFVLKYCYIFIPLISAAIMIVFTILSYRYFKKSFIPLKNQIRKLNNVVGENKKIDDFESDSVSLSNSIRTTRKEIENLLNEKESYASQLNFILDSIEQGMIVLSNTNDILIFNKKALEIFNVNSDDQNKLENVYKNIEIYKLIKIALRLNSRSQDYVQIESRIYECEVFPLYFSWIKKNDKPGVSILLIDVTDEYNSKKMKEEFFANVAHEIKSPLTSILGYQEMIKDGIITTEEEIKEANTITIKEAHRLKDIVSNMLGLSSIEKNELRSIEKINLKAGIEEIIKSEEYKIKEKKIKVILDLKPYILKMNPQDFDIVFRNIIENAIKYNKVGGFIKIIIDEKTDEIIIEDSGIGIEEEYLNRIFERFFRINKARSLKDGTGLGLALVKHTCLYYDFKISVVSKIDVGTKFIIKLK